jgi:hypothetical protein
MSRDNTPNKHDGDGEGVYQPDKTEKPKDYGRGRHDRDESPEKDE